MHSFRKLYVFLIALFVLPALACQATSVTNLFATPTPTPTNTPTVTPTPTITATPTPTETPLPTLTPTPLPTGVTSEENADSTTRLIDYDNKYQILLPKGWVVIPMTGQDMADLVDRLSTINPEFKDAAETFNSIDPDFVRAIALNRDGKYLVKGFASNITILTVQEKMLTIMPIEFVTGAFEENFEQSGGKVITQGVNVIKSETGVDVGIVEVEQQTPTGAGQRIDLRLKLLMFVADDKLVILTLSTPRELIADLNPDIDFIANSVELLTP